MITSVTAVVSGPWSYIVQAVSDMVGARFYWWKDGVFFLETAIGELEVPAKETVWLDVFDSATDRPQKGISYGMVLMWEAVSVPAGMAAIERYRVERWTGSAWTELQEYKAGRERLFRHVQKGLADETVHRLRVVAVDLAGGETVVVDEEGLLVRRPDVPEQVFVLVEGEISAGNG